MTTVPAGDGAEPLGRASAHLDDRVVVVTGAAAGIGRATAMLMAEFGATVAICDRDAAGLDQTAQAVAAHGRPARAAELDVRDAGAVDGFVDSVVAQHGRVDVLVNNAGGTFFAPFLDVSAGGEAALIAENFTQVTHLIRRGVAAMPDRGGAVVNVTSIEAHQAAPGFAVYGAMKTALASLTRTLALELAPRRVRVNAIAPDAIPTSGDDELQDRMRESPGAFDPAVLPPLGRFGRPDDAAAAAVFLAGDLSRFVTGTTIHVDGGNWAAGGWRLVAEGGR
jgi:NAD(P)-dependent dehydrogenase (short-subunit alcohol dehydrogenase family)